MDWLPRAFCPTAIEVTMASKQWHLISYDVRDPKRLRRVAKTLESYGTRLQYSVFRCRLDTAMLERLHWQLAEIMEDVDDLLVIPLCRHCASQVPDHSTGDQSSWSEMPTFKVL
jgi:CRISPR-associated protein Cas2